MDPFNSPPGDDNWAPLEVHARGGYVEVEIDGDEYTYHHDLRRVGVEALVKWLQTWLEASK